MIRIAIGADLHLEFEYPFGPDQPSGPYFRLRDARKALKANGHPQIGPLLSDLRGAVDAVILAGDIDLGRRAVTYADQVARYLGVPVIQIAGNHEFYKGNRSEVISAMREAAERTEGRVTYLENETATIKINGILTHLLGCTLWTDYQIGTDGSDVETYRAMDNADRDMNDSAMIADGSHGQPFSARRAREVHLASRAWLSAEVERLRAVDPAARLIIVTHHGPIAAAARSGGGGPEGYASDLTSEIAAWRPLAWIFGHTHQRATWHIGETLVMTHGRGYVGHEQGAVDFDLKIIEA